MENENHSSGQDWRLGRRVLRLCPMNVSSATTLPHEKPNPSEDWTIVLPRRGGKQTRRKYINSKRTSQQELPWVPIEHEVNPIQESKLMKKMKVCLEKLESSEFFCKFTDQICTSQISDNISRVLGSEEKMNMVIYGIGSIESREIPRMQLGLAILMKRRFRWIGDVQVFDPILSGSETRVLKTLGFSVLSVNEQGRRKALKSTLFYMPHCEAELYDNLLRANWNVEMLSRIVLFGNSFNRYEEFISIFKNSIVATLGKHLLAVQRFTAEFGIQEMVSNDYFDAFHDLSWHFFSFDPDMELQFGKMTDLVDNCSEND